jgi:hypothetical protein
LRELDFGLALVFRADHKQRDGRGGSQATGKSPGVRPAHPPGNPLQKAGRGAQGVFDLPAAARVNKDFAERLLSSQGIEQSLVRERSFEQRSPFLVGEGAGCVSADQLFDILALHVRFSQAPPIHSMSCLRQRESQV